MTLQEAVTRIAMLQAQVDRLMAMMQSTQAQVGTIAQAIPRPRGEWTERVRVQGVKFTLAEFTGIPTQYVRIYFDAVTPPSYTTSTSYEAAQWGDESIIVRMEDLYAHVGDYLVHRG